jgi:hypothetical protein
MEMKTKTLAMAVAAVATVTASAQAVLMQVEITGEVEWNQISAPPLGNASPMDLATLAFIVDSDIYANSPNYPTRGYEIDQSSFTLTFGTTVVGLQDPFPAGSTPYFVLRDNDPAVDGFFVSTDLDWPLGVPLEQMGMFEQFSNNFSVGYSGDTLSSLDILDAVGTYDYTGLQNYNWTVTDGPFDAMGIGFTQMTISVVPAPATLALLAPFGFLGRRRRD